MISTPTSCACCAPRHDFVPVRVGQVGYLYDRVSGQLFGNAGTGSFVIGPDTFRQGVLPTRMMVAGVRKKLPYDAGPDINGV